MQVVLNIKEGETWFGESTVLLETSIQVHTSWASPPRWDDGRGRAPGVTGMKALWY